jgi:acetamidase/formamidase
MGEVCGTAIETPIKATLRFELIKNQPWVTSPQYQTPPRAQIPNPLPDLGTYGALGVSPDLFEAAKSATRNLIQWLVLTKGLTKSEAYILASVAGDLQIAEIVNVPNYEVSMSIPLGIFSSA